MRALLTWAHEWIVTLRNFPPFSQRRRELHEILADDNPDNWIEVERP